MLASTIQFSTTTRINTTPTTTRQAKHHRTRPPHTSVIPQNPNSMPQTVHHTMNTPMFHKKLTHPPTTHNEPHRMMSPYNEVLLRKEVIQPHLPVRLPCYDLVLITSPTFDGSPTQVRPPASGVTDFHDLTGGVYKPRERIHRSVADLRLLATPTS